MLRKGKGCISGWKLNVRPDDRSFVAELKEYSVTEYIEGVFTEDYNGLVIQKRWLSVPGQVNVKISRLLVVWLEEGMEKLKS